MNRKVLLIIVGLVAVFIVIGFARRKKTAAVSKPVSSAAVAKQLYKEASALKRDRKLLEAKERYQKILSDHSGIDNMEGLQKELEEVNLDIIFSNLQTPKTVIHEVQPGDTLGKIARKYGTTAELLKRSNNLKSDVIQLGQKLRVWTGAFNIFVDKSQNILILKSENEVVKVYNVSTGENNSTPVGKFKITSKLVDPVWFSRGAIVPPESPQNVLGSRWMGFDLPGYGIHGTIEPETIGRQITAGCVRMINEQVEELYSIVPMGTEVTIVE
ncbi:MAG: L,D-transpeptidase family protein [Candidatus Omnitrophota bacterium]